MKIYTGFGDQGNTALFGGQVVKKNHARVEIYGTLDELNSVIGLLRCKNSDEEVDGLLNQIQNEIFVVSAELATPEEKMRDRFMERIDEHHIQGIEQRIDHFSENLDPLKQFILPGGSEAATFAHLARTVCRRAERKLVALSKYPLVRKELLIYLNRLSDLFFVLARYQNKRAGQPDVKWKGLK
jgi:cob(I)alamin adenosyltransferase